MALRLLPFRQYAEQDVINLYKVNIASSSNNAMATPFVNGENDNGVLVEVSAGNMDGDPVDYVSDSYLGKTDYPFIGRDQYPVVSLAVKAADSSSSTRPLGVTLRQTLTHDENGEKLLYYPQKALEMQAVLTGQAVPVLTRGVITVDGDTAFDGTEPTAVGVQVYQGDNSNQGKFSTTDNDTAGAIGVVIASGNRVNRGVSPDQFAGNSVGTGAANTSGSYYVINLDCK